MCSHLSWCMISHPNDVAGIPKVNALTSDQRAGNQLVCVRMHREDPSRIHRMICGNYLKYDNLWRASQGDLCIQILHAVAHTRIKVLASDLN